MALQSLESNPQLSFATRMEDWQKTKEKIFAVLSKDDWGKRKGKKKTNLKMLRNLTKGEFSD